MADFEARIRGCLPADVTLRYQDTIDSTNRLARELAMSGAPDGTLVVADRQASGRGQAGRTWHSPSGVGVWMTMIARPDLPARITTLLPLAVGVGVAESLEARSGVPIRVKWPNDVYALDRKMGGVLVESATHGDRVQWVILGVGINVCQRDEEFPEDVRGRAISLWGAGGAAVSREDVIGDVVPAVRSRVRNLGPDVLRAFEARSWLEGRRVVLLREGAASVSGRYAGVDGEGALLLETDAGVRAFRSGHVDVIDA